MEEKLNLHELILKKKLKNAYVNKELKEKRENINEIIENKKIKNEKKTSNKYEGNDIEFEKIKREKLEKEFYKLLEEIKETKEEVNLLNIFYLLKFFFFNLNRKEF